MKQRAWPTIVVGAVASTAVWALSPWLTGRPEPWDADSAFYIAGLIVAGVLAGLLRPRPLWAHYAGAVAGQAAYELAFLAVGPLFVLGVAFLLGYSVVFVIAAAAGGWLGVRWRRRSALIEAGPATLDRQGGGDRPASNGTGSEP